MAKKSPRPRKYDDTACLDGGTTVDFAEPERPAERTSTNVPKELARRLDSFAQATHIPIKDQVITALDLYLKIHADQDRSGAKLIPSRTHNRLQRLAAEFDTTEGWFARVGTSVVCELLEAPGEQGADRLFDNIYLLARERECHVAEMLADLVRQAVSALVIEPGSARPSRPGPSASRTVLPKP